MTILDLYPRLTLHGYDNKHADWLYLGCRSAQVRDEAGHGEEWFEEKLKEQLEIDRRRVFQCYFAQDKQDWSAYYMQADDQYRHGKIDFAVDYLLNQ